MAEIIKISGYRKTSFDFSQKENIRKLREELGLSAAEFGAVIGTNEENENQGRLIRKWESGQIIPSKLAQRAMTTLSMGVPMGEDHFTENIPEFVLSAPNQNEDEVLIHLYYPRYIAILSNDVFSTHFEQVISGLEYLNLSLLMDPAPLERIKESLKKAADFVNNYTDETDRLFLEDL